MNRQQFTATLYTGDTALSTATGYALNSTITKSEALVRAHARALGVIFHGDRPTRTGDVYTREWHSGNTTVRAVVQPA
jgi:hypothetical protein